MNENKVWTEWEGQVAAKTFRLEKFLGSTDHSVVFLTEIAQPGSRKAVIKFISADFPGAEKQLDAWAAAAVLSHPNLLQIYAEGRCKLEDMDLLYVVMEYAEENLGQFLPQRAMTSEETRQVLNTAADVLVYLHDKGLTHGHLKPSNVLATGDQLKFSSDTILAAGEVRGLRRERDAYDAPETASSPMSATGDVWSLGITVVEALTQQPPVLPFDDKADPPIPATLAEPFLEIARQTLRREAKWRWSSAHIAARLNPAATAPKAAAASAGVAARPAAAAAKVPPPPAPPAVGTVSPLSVPLSKEPAVPLAKLPVPERVPPRVETPRPPNRTLALPSYVVPLFAGVLALAAILVLPRILRRHMETSLASIETTSQNSSAKPAAVAATTPNPVEKPVQVEAPAPAKPAAKDTAKVAAEKSGAPENAPALSALTTSTPAVLRSDNRATSGVTKSASASPARGEVLEQVLPKASENALSTISGTVRVGVKAHVDAAGNVAEAELDSPGPSRYFADLALDAARRWLFDTPEVDGRSVPSEWLIRFEFTRSGVKASANQSAK